MKRATVLTGQTYLSRSVGRVTKLNQITLETGNPESFVPEYVAVTGWTARRDRPLRLSPSAEDAAELARGLLRMVAG